MPEPEFLPFARPSIDAETIAAVGAVLASGWITSGPRVLEFEAALSRSVRRPARARARQRHRRRWRSRCASPASAPATR